MTATELVAVLTEARLKQRLGRPRLSTRLGCARHTLLRWEFRRCSPPLDAVVAWAAALGYQVALIPADQPNQEAP
ncbi:helix-turn-helix domain-containing protein [Actinomadura geliboluensis]|uniref:helix-turn-helix domain-containing protein n=1 Tax=Actinomadura geliboluensis TaxID=882440 RepID=UPI0036C754C8